MIVPPEVPGAEPPSPTCKAFAVADTGAPEAKLVRSRNAVNLINHSKAGKESGLHAKAVYRCVRSCPSACSAPLVLECDQKY